jgi:membrane protein DedA with SNARE-associated domain
MSADAAPIDDEPGRASRLPDVLCGAGLVAAALSGLLSAALTPSLLSSHPVLLEALTGSTASMVTAGAFARVGRASLALAVVAAVPGVMMFDPFYWWAGRRWGRGAVHMLVGHSPRTARALRRTEEWTRRYGRTAVALGYVLPVPNALIYAAAGWTGMRLRTFIVLDVIGALLWIGILVGLGFALGQSAVHVANAISRYALVVTLGLVVLAVAWQGFKARQAGL